MAVKSVKPNSEIEVLKLRFPEDIRTRFDMYIGSAADPNQIIQELIDNGIDEVLAGYATSLKIYTTLKYAVVADNGRGIPVYEDKDDPTVPITKALFCETHTGSKFKQADSQNTAFSRGKNGVGTKATNALSDRFIAIVNLKKKDLSTTLESIRNSANQLKNPVYAIEFNRGILQSQNVIEANTAAEFFGVSEINSIISSDWSSISISFPDPTIFTSVETKIKAESLQLVPLVNPKAKLHIELNGELLPKLNISDLFLKTIFFEEKIFEINVDLGATRWMIMFGFSDNDITESHRGSVNTLSTNDGFHVNFATKLLGTAFSSVFPSANAADIKYGLRLFALALCQEPQYTSQTKEKLSKIPEFDEKVATAVMLPEFQKIMKSNKDYFAAIFARIQQVKSEMGKLHLQDFIKSQVVKGGESKTTRGLGTQVYDCSVQNRSNAELFVVEGQSAAGTLVQCRDPKIHAVLPLRGKPLNASATDVQTTLANAEMKSLINVIGAGIDPYVEIKKARYGRVILLADADPDGKSINALLLGTLGTYLMPMIEAGMIYVSVMPLFKQGTKFIWDREELDETKPFKRFKGLGEMNPDELFETAVNSKTRKLLRITNDGSHEAFQLLRTTTAKYKLMVSKGIVEK